MDISKNYIVSKKLLSSYFISSFIFLIISFSFVIGVDVTKITFDSKYLIAWSHFFLIGFIILAVFGLILQFLPTIAKKDLDNKNFFILLFSIILSNILLSLGFIFSINLVIVGGGLLVVSFLWYLFEINSFIKDDLSIFYFKVANFFLFISSLIGFILVLSISGYLMPIYIEDTIKSHIFFIVGFILILILAFSIILLSSFGKKIDLNKIKLSFTLILIGLVLIAINSIFYFSFIIDYIGYSCFLIVIILHILQIYQKRKDDYYSKFIFFAYLSLIVAIIFIIIYFNTFLEDFLLSASWLLFGGFFSLIIIANIYKSFPYIIWYYNKDLKLKEILPLKSVNLSLYTFVIGIILSNLGILVDKQVFFQGGVDFLIVGSFFTMITLVNIIKK